MHKDIYPGYTKPLTVVVVGLGKIGLPLAIQFAKCGHYVIGCDINPKVVESINAGITPIKEELELITDVPRLVNVGLISATLDTRYAVQRADVVVIIVPVSIDLQYEVDYSKIDDATAKIGAALQPGTLVIYESTLPVGTTASRLRSMLEVTSRLKAGLDFKLAYSPERVSSGSIFHDLHTYPKVVGGINEESAKEAARFYHAMLDAEIILMASTEEAEFVKLIETTYRDVNIALANEFARFADVNNLDAAAAIAAANTHPYAHIHNPGVGVGGHCIPVYPYFLLTGTPIKYPFYKERKSEPFLMIPYYARIVNDSMAEYAVQRIEKTIGSLEGQTVLILGIAYRGNVHEATFSSAELLQKSLMNRGACVYVHDPLFSEDELSSLGYCPLTSGLENQICAIILQSNHDIYHTFDFARFPRCKVVLDGRHVLDRVAIEACGIRYIAIGDGNPK